MILLALALTACAPAPIPAPPTPDAGAALLAAAASGDVDRILGALTLEQRAAQLVMPWIAGSYAALDDSVLARVGPWIDPLGVGGIIVSIGSPLDIAAKVNALQARAALPLLVAADLEGSSAFRFVGGTVFPPNMGLAAAGGDREAYAVARITAIEGRAVGIHLTFAPVADVNNNPANPIINTRSFGEDPSEVARLVTATVRGLQEHGLLATAKHFPGHGDTDLDSHIALPVLSADWPRLDSLELVPFRAAIAAGVAAVMSAHVALPELEPSRQPATLAPSLLTGLLRDSLGFQGLVVTDALDMVGVVNGAGGATGEAAVLALEAGADLLLQPGDPALVVQAVAAAVRGGRVSRERLDRSVRRVLALKRDLGLFRTRAVSLDRIPAVVGTTASQAFAEELTARSIVLARDDAGAVDSLRAGPRPVALVCLVDEATPSLGTTLAADLRAAGYPVARFRLWPASGPASLDSARALLAGNRTTVFVSAVRASSGSGVITLPPAFAQLIDSAAAISPTVLVSLGSPYLIQQTPRVGAYVLGWAPRSSAELAVARALRGAAPITGRLPISIPPMLSRGSGLVRGVP